MMKKLISVPVVPKIEVLDTGHHRDFLENAPNPVFRLIELSEVDPAAVCAWIKDGVRDTLDQLLSHPNKAGVIPTSHFIHSSPTLFRALRPFFTWINTDKATYVQRREGNKGTPSYQPSLKMAEAPESWKPFYAHMLLQFQAVRPPQRQNKADVVDQFKTVLFDWIVQPDHIAIFLETLVADTTSLVNAMADQKPGTPPIPAAHLFSTVTNFHQFVVVRSVADTLTQVGPLSALTDIDSSVVVVVGPPKTTPKVYDAIDAQIEFRSLLLPKQQTLLAARLRVAHYWLRVLTNPTVSEEQAVTALTQLFFQIDFVAGYLTLADTLKYNDYMSSSLETLKTRLIEIGTQIKAPKKIAPIQLLRLPKTKEPPPLLAVLEWFTRLAEGVNQQIKESFRLRSGLAPILEEPS